jgi:hypothetical protein
MQLPIKLIDSFPFNRPAPFNSPVILAGVKKNQKFFLSFWFILACRFPKIGFRSVSMSPSELRGTESRAPPTNALVTPRTYETHAVDDIIFVHAHATTVRHRGRKPVQSSCACCC